MKLKGERCMEGNTNNKRGFTTTDIDTILREYGLTPRWDYSKVGESVIVVRKNRELSPKDA